MTDKSIPINFAIQSYKTRGGLASAERIVNMYAEPSPTESKSKVSLFKTPGTTMWATLNNFNPIYGMIVMVDNLYVVCGLNVYKIDSTKTVTSIGTMSTTPGRVMMTENGTQVTILTESGIAYYCTPSADSLLQITDDAYQLANSVCTIDGYTVFTKKDSQVFFISALNDTSSYSALDFASAEAESDNLTVCLNYLRQLILIGTRSTEIWYDTGNNTFPFERIDGALIKRGTPTKYSAVSDMTGTYWLGDDKIVYQATGYAPNRISTYGVEKAIESYDVIDDAFSFIYTQEGHKFYILTFPTQKKTWVYDITAGLWHERSSTNPNMRQDIYGPWLANCHASFFNQELIGDANTGNIYQLDLGVKTENGVPIISQVTSVLQFHDYERTTFNRFALWMNTGVGIDGDAQGVHPEILLEVSTDAGKTFSNQIPEPLGEIGTYETEVFWHQLGWGRSLLLRITISDPVFLGIAGAYLNITQGKS